MMYIYIYYNIYPETTVFLFGCWSMWVYPEYIVLLIRLITYRRSKRPGSSRSSAAAAREAAASASASALSARDLRAHPEDHWSCRELG